MVDALFNRVQIFDPQGRYLLAFGELANPGTIDLPLEGTELQCTSCHDLHDKDLEPFLWKTTDQARHSAMSVTAVGASAA